MELRRWETATRYYECRIYEDLFGEPILMTANGGKGLRLGMTRIVAAGRAQIHRLMAEIETTRLRHGYRECVLPGGASRPAPELVQAQPVAHPDKRIRHNKVHRARRKRHPVVVND